MSSPEFRNGSPRARAPRDGAARNVMHAVAERELGRRRLKATTVTVGFASVAAAGAVAVSLPGSTHAAVTGTNRTSSSTGGVSRTSTSDDSTSRTTTTHDDKARTSSGSTSSGSTGAGSTGSGSAGSSNSSNASNSSSNSGNLQAPANPPAQSGGGQVTSGGTSSF